MNIQNAHIANELTPEHFLALARKVKPVRRTMLDMASQAASEMREEMEMPITGEFYD